MERRKSLMQVIKIKDNNQLPEEHFSSIKTLTDKIANKTLEELEKEGIFIFPETVADSEDISREQMILQKINHGYSSGNIMGFLGYGNERLVIESRFCGNGEDYFFQYLLNIVLDYPNFINLETDAENDSRLFNFLLFLFPYYLKEAMRKGLFKKYICNKYNNTNVHGTIDIARHIQLNTPFTGNVAYSQREFSFDNSLTQLIRHTTEFIKHKPFAKNLLSKVKEEVNDLINATQSYEYFDRQNIIIQNKKNTIQHAYYREYRALQRLCLLILQHQKHQIGVGSKNIYGILFDGAWLWEEYLATILEGKFNHYLKDTGKRFYLFKPNKQQIIPDYLSLDKKIVADAKYIPLNEQNYYQEGSEKAIAIYYKTIAYMYRFCSKKGYLLYPHPDEEVLPIKEVIKTEIVGENGGSITKLGLRIPSGCNSFASFISLMNKHEQDFTNLL